MSGKNQTTTPRWIVVQLADDLNWWVEQTSEEMGASGCDRGALDPRQVQELTDKLTELRRYGVTANLVDAAFRCYEVEAEVGPNQLRLAATGFG